MAVLGIDGLELLKPGTITGMREAAGGRQGAASDPPGMCVCGLCIYMYTAGYGVKSFEQRLQLVWIDVLLLMFV